MKISEVITLLVQFSILAVLAVLVWNQGKRSADSIQPEIPQASSITQTANPTIINNNARGGWNDSVPHTVNDAAEFLNRTPDTIRSYIPRWIDDGEAIEKTQGGMWIFPPGFTPYVPD